MTDKLGTMIVVGRARFHAGCKVATAQCAIDRLWDRYEKLNALVLKIDDFKHRLPPEIEAEIDRVNSFAE